MMDNKSRMMGDCQVRFCERPKLKCFCLLDYNTRMNALIFFKLFVHKTNVSKFAYIFIFFRY